MRRLLILSFALLALIPARADALTVRDVVELARAGLGDDIILALIEVDRSVFPIDTATLKTLQAAGVGERVILAMIRSQRTQPAVPVADVTDAPEALAAAQPPPQVIVIDHHEERVRQVLVPVYVPVVRRQRHPSDVYVSDVYVNDRQFDTRPGLHEPRPQRKPPAEPVYWGWDGKLRPDAWKPK